MITPDIRELLDTEAARINNPDFIPHDPVQFPRRYTAEADIEIAALLSATIAWGNRKMICRDCDRLLTSMDSSPAAYTLDGAFEDLDPDANIHRTFFNRNLIHYLRGLRTILRDHGTIGAWAHKTGIAATEAPAWEFARQLSAVITQANDGIPDSRCLPGNIDKTALKRINMAFRWLVRRDGIVDIGIWRFLSPSQLYIPLDVHVGNVSRQLGLITRRQDDRRAVNELTARLRTIRPDDPALYDYALFGIGITSKTS